VGEAERDLDDRRRGDVRRELAREDRKCPLASREGGGDVVVCDGGLGCASNYASDAWDVDDRDRPDQYGLRRAEAGDEDEDEEERRQREDHVEQACDERVDDAAAIRGENAEAAADEEG